MTREIDVPKELEVLLPELNKGVVVIGARAYEVLPVVEGQLELIIGEIAEVLEMLDCPDGKCPKCEKVVKNARPRKIFTCPDDGEALFTMNVSPVEGVIKSSKIPKWVEMITGVPADEAKKSMTFKQIKHFAGLFWMQNFSDEGMPEESLANFKKLLKMVGPEEKKTSPAAEKEQTIEKPQP